MADRYQSRKPVRLADIKPKLWYMGRNWAVLYDRPASIKRILAWNCFQILNTQVMDEYYDTRNACFALQIVVPARYYNRLARAVGLPENPKTIRPASEERKAQLGKARASRKKTPGLLSTIQNTVQTA